MRIGILKNASDAKTYTETSQISEELQIAINGISVDYYTGNNSESFRDYIFSSEEGKGQSKLNAELGEENLSFDTTNYQITYKGIVFDVTGDKIEEANPITQDVAQTTISYVGYYADIDKNGSIDGIIYADLLVGQPDEGEWGLEDYSHTYELPTDVSTANVKDYVVSETPVTDARFEKAGADPSTYTPRYVVSPANSTTGTKDRFYVMGLNDITDGTNSYFNWYYEASDSQNLTGTMTDYETYTSDAFGKGRENTTKMLTKWEAEGYGEQNNRDLWKWINVKEGQSNAGWFVPSIGEWTAFACAFNINNANVELFGFTYSEVYWSSSQYSIHQVYVALPYFEYIDKFNASYSDSKLRLSTTF